MPAERGKKSKTSRFPVARIKKIMQLDEEVGKLASATPIMISKSLECFLQLIIEETSKEPISKGFKKITAQHLKQTILKNQSFDFLLPLTVSISGPTGPSEPKPKPKARKSNPNPEKNSEPRAKRKKKTVARDSDHEDDDEEDDEGNGEGDRGKGFKEEGEGNLVPKVENWGKDKLEGGGGSGEGGRGMFDDYEEDEDDY